MPTPDDDGRLELSHRAWQHVDEVVWTMGLEITALSLAYNRLAHIAPELGDLKLLRELDCSCNKLQALPAKIGALRQLRKLKCNGNSLEHLPDEIGQCRQLEEIICSENKLVALPRALLGREHGSLRSGRVAHAHARVGVHEGRHSAGGAALRKLSRVRRLVATAGVPLVLLLALLAVQVSFCSTAALAGRRAFENCCRVLCRKCKSHEDRSM